MKIIILSSLFSLLVHASLFIQMGNDSNSQNLKFNQGGGVVRVKLVRPKAESQNSSKPETAQESNTLQGIVSKAVTKGQVAPEYPYRSRVLGEEGIVKARIVVAGSGEAREIEIISSSGFERLDSAVLSALEKSQFQAAKNAKGLNVEDSFELEFKFLLNQEEQL